MILHKAIQLDPANYQAYYTLGKAYRLKDNIEFSIKWFEKALRRTKEPANIFFHLAGCFDSQNDQEKALKLYKQWLAIDKNHFRAWIYYATLLAKNHQIHKACKYCRHALKIHPENLDVHFMLGNFLYKGKDTKKIAIKHFKHILETNAEFPKAKYLKTLLESELLRSK